MEHAGTATLQPTLGTFVFSFTELTTSIPRAGGPFDCARRAFGPAGGYLAGYATLVEFVFAPPAIALAIGAYLHAQFAGLSPRVAAVGAYLVFMALNIAGVQIAATFELVVTLLAIGELPVFMGLVAPAFSLAGGWAHHDVLTVSSLGGMLAAIPFAIWFFLAIEGVAIMGCSRQIYALARAGYLPTALGAVHPRFRTPHRAILAGGGICIVAIFSDSLVTWGGQTLTANIVTLSVFGAIVMYLVSMASLLRLRRIEPALARPFRAPCYPWFPVFASIAAAVCLATMVYFNPLLAALFAAAGGLGDVHFLTTGGRRRASCDGAGQAPLAGGRRSGSASCTAVATATLSVSASKPV